MLNKLALRAKQRVAAKKKLLSPAELMRQTEKMSAATGFPFEKALRKDGVSLICEVKHASPSQGVISEHFPYIKIAREYETAGADAISVLTEPYYFKGDDRYLAEISRNVSLPLLRKDFTVDAYMIYEAKLLGASAVLLIAALLAREELAEYVRIAHRLGLSALVEIHSEAEVAAALDTEARIIGVNNRDLKTFAVDITTSERLRSLIPADRIFVSESGLKTPADIRRLREIGADAALIGETLMRSADKITQLKKLRGDL